MAGVYIKFQSEGEEKLFVALRKLASEEGNVEEGLKKVTSAINAVGDGFSKLDREAGRVLRDIQTPAEKFAQTQERLKVLLDNNKLSQEQYNRALDQAKQRFSEVGETGAKGFGRIGDLVRENATELKGFALGLIGGGGVLGAVQTVTAAFEQFRASHRAAMKDATDDAVALTEILGGVGRTGDTKFFDEAVAKSMKSGFTEDKSRTALRSLLQAHTAMPKEQVAELLQLMAPLSVAGMDVGQLGTHIGELSKRSSGLTPQQLVNISAKSTFAAGRQAGELTDKKFLKSGEMLRGAGMDEIDVQGLGLAAIETEIKLDILGKVAQSVSDPEKPASREELAAKTAAVMAKNRRYREDLERNKAIGALRATDAAGRLSLLGEDWAGTPILGDDAKAFQEINAASQSPATKAQRMEVARPGNANTAFKKLMQAGAPREMAQRLALGAAKTDNFGAIDRVVSIMQGKGIPQAKSADDLASQQAEVNRDMADAAKAAADAGSLEGFNAAGQAERMRLLMTDDTIGKRLLGDGFQNWKLVLSKRPAEKAAALRAAAADPNFAKAQAAPLAGSEAVGPTTLAIQSELAKAELSETRPDLRLSERYKDWMREKGPGAYKATQQGFFGGIISALASSGGPYGGAPAGAIGEEPSRNRQEELVRGQFGTDAMLDFRAYSANQLPGGNTETGGGSSEHTQAIRENTAALKAAHDPHQKVIGKPDDHPTGTMPAR